MNEQTFTTSSEDMVIDLVDLFFSLLKKWRSLLVLILIGAILGGALGFVKGRPVAPAAMLEEPTPNVEQAILYHKLVDQQMDYNTGSLLMQMDPNSAYTAKLTYYLTASGNEEAQKVATAAFEGMLDKELLTKLRESSGLKCEARFFSELVTEGTDPLAVPADQVVVPAQDKDHCVQFRILSTSRASCQAMLEVLTAAAEKLEAELRGRFFELEAYVVTSSVEQAAYNEIHRYQLDNVTRLNTLRSSLKSAEGALDEAETACYQMLTTGESQEAPVELTLNKGTVIKWLVIGVFLGIVAWGGCLVVAYLLDSKVKTITELQDTYRIALLGCLPAGKNGRKGLDKWLDGLHNKTKKAPDTAEYLTTLISAMEAGDVVLCGDRENEEVAAAMKALAGGKIQTAGFTSTDAASLSQVKAAGKEILVVRTGLTRRKAVQRELELCRMQKIKLLGMIVID